MTRVLALLALLIFLIFPFREGWTRAETDFPNYYTAAVLVRQSQPLRNFYDWTWFQRETNFAGTDDLGGYAAQTPLAMLPLLPVSYLPVQNAKQVWLLCNLGFLALTIWLLTRITRFRFELIWLLTFCAYTSLHTNFSYGQYYIFLLFLLTVTFYLFSRGFASSSGCIAGIAFALKLYGGPLFLFFFAKRKWKAAVSMIATGALLGGLALMLFGWANIHFYLAQILPRSLQGSPIDPYSSGVATFSNMFRHWFMAEPELNPHPLWNFPPLFFFLRTFLSLAIVGSVFVGVATRPSSDRRDFAWFLIAILLLSSSTSSYTFILLLLPLVLLLEESDGWEGPLFVACYVFINLPLHPGWLFLKVWLLFLWFIVIRRDLWPALRRPAVALAAAACILLALADARAQMHSFSEEPAQHFQSVALEQGALFSGFPVISPAGLFYQSMGRDRYVLRWLHDGRNEQLSFDGEAFYPSAAADGSIHFELVAHGTSKAMRFDPTTRSASAIAAPAPTRGDDDQVVSPDGKWIAGSSESTGSRQIWLRSTSTGEQRILTGGKCNSSSPAWELDSKALVFASDCGRAFGTPSLYRATVP